MDCPKQRISVALCTYNGDLYLDQQLRSIAAQTRLPNELVICDDNSNDQTPEVIKAFASTAPFPVRLYPNEENLGTTKNFEKAISLCRGDVIALSDQDDVWHKEKLARTEVFLLARPAVGVVFHDAAIVDKDLEDLGHTLWEFMDFNQPTSFKLQKSASLLLRRNPAFGQNMLFRACFRDLILPIPAEVGADMWIGLLIGLSAEVALVKEPLLKYRQHAGQQTGDVARKPRLVDKVRDGHFSARKDLAANLNLCEHAFDRLRTIDGAQAQRSGGLIREKAEHLKARTNLPAGMAARFSVVLRELLTARYHHYSNGGLSALKDLFG